MTNRFWVVLALLLVIPGLIFTASCAKKGVESGPAVTPATTAEEEADTRRLAEERARQEALVAQKAIEEQRLLEERLREEARQRRKREELAARHRFLKEDIHFEFDKSRLLPEAKEILRYKAEWLMAHPAVTVIIEGHCDERGNMALGNRRAESVKRFVVDLGIAPERVTTVSYGEERPLDPRHNEEALAKNRRAHFVMD
ncbi:MAG: OmpA family protein [Deltaproteobacteria bacterium]|nr:OmpA family protein [Deltaproteobacteria bacterium]